MGIDSVTGTIKNKFNLQFLDAHFAKPQCAYDISGWNKKSTNINDVT